MRFLTLLIAMLLLASCSGSTTEQAADSISAESTPTQAESPTDTPQPTDAPPTAEPTAIPPTEPPPPTATALPEPTLEAPTPEPETVSPTGVEGALIAITMQSNVGILLDGLPTATREQLINDWLNAPAEMWAERAERQTRLARLRLNFRNFYVEGKGQLPMPPQPAWTFEMDAAGPSIQTIDDHELIMHAYTFRSMLLTDQASVPLAEPALEEIGGLWEEAFIFPADPDHLLQRTGNACLDEGGFPPNSYDAINAWHFYDYTCTADSNALTGGCHRNRLAATSCREAMTARIGEVEATMQFERLAWDVALADSVRMGAITSTDGPDLVTLTEDMNHNRIVYRYFADGDCAFIEGATGGSGWRRLLLFDATVHNTSPIPLHIGKANVADPVNNVFIFAPCHAHFHYSNYGDFYIGGQEGLTGGKQAFCVQSTNRASNNEASPLVHDYTCSFQGIEAGWVDEYIAGLDAQWVDITDVELPAEGGNITLGFASNLDKFMCEGSPIVDEDGVQLWEPSDFLTVDGHTINRPRCDFIPNWDVNNVSELELFIPPTGSYVTQPCTESLLGPLRNCGFTEVALDVNAVQCAVGQDVTVPLSGVEIEGALAVRVCERSEALGSLACEQTQSVANRIVSSSAESITFSCPLVRDSANGSGGFSLYVAPLYEGSNSAE